MRSTRQEFTADEDGVLRDHYRSVSDRELAARLRRPIGSVAHRLRRLGLRRDKCRPFTPEEDAAIRNGKGRSSTEVARELRRAPAVIRMRARRLGIPSWKAFNGGLREYRGYAIARIHQGEDGSVRRVPEHRAVMERHLGRSLLDSERVHHINARKRDNRIENLHLCPTDAAHSRAHHSLTTLLPDLLERGIVCFDLARGVYELCEINNSEPFCGPGTVSAVV